MKFVLTFLLMVAMSITSSFGSILTSDSISNGWQDFSNIYSLTTSADGSGKSYRHFLLGTGIFAGNPVSPGQALDFWGTGSGNYKPDSQGSYFTENSYPASAQGTLLIEIAGWRDVNWLGYYERDNPGVVKTIFNGADQANVSNGNVVSTPLSKTFTVNGDWALVFMPNFNSSGTPTWAQVLASGFFQDGNRNSQFLINRDFVGQFYYIGIEDTLQGDRDHNDMILRIKNTEAETGEVPEPSTYALCGAALMVLALHRRKK